MRRPRIYMFLGGAGFNNAGVMRTINFHDVGGNLQDVTGEIDINLHGPIRMVKQFLPHLKSKPTAAIVNVSSGLAFTLLPTSPVYCATKAAIHSFTLSLRVQLGQTKVKVFELAPPATKTELLGDFDPVDMKGISGVKLGAPVRHADKQSVIRLLASQSMSSREIAKVVGASQSTVIRTLREREPKVGA